MTAKNQMKMSIIVAFIIFPAGAVASIYANHPVIGGIISGAIIGTMLMKAKNRLEREESKRE